MYERFYGFHERPFDLTPNPRYLVPTTMHREALSNLQYAIASRKGLALLVGDAGSGKTTVIRAALEQQPDAVHYIHLHNPKLTRDEFVEMLAARFDLSDKARSSKAALLLELETLLRARRAAQETTVLVVDEAQSLSLELLEEIRLLANIETDSDKLLTVIIAGHPDIAQRLNEPALRQLKQRVALRCELRPLSNQETAAYIAGRIRAAGGIASRVFTREAVALIHEHSQGVPRTINVLADNALLVGFATEQKLVGAGIVREVCADFDFAASAESAPEATVMTSDPEPPARVAPAVVPTPTPVPTPHVANRVLGLATAGQPAAPIVAPTSSLLNPPEPKRRLFSFFSR